MWTTTGPPLPSPSPGPGQFWPPVEEYVRSQVPKAKMAYMHHMCQHCDEAPCIPACKSNAIYKRPDGAVIIDPTKCTRQRNCLDACPYGVIFYIEDVQIAQKCTWCA